MRELIVDDAIEFAALRHDAPLSAPRDLERVVWDAIVKRVRRAHEGRYDTVRAGHQRAAPAELEALVSDSDPAATVERRAELALVREFAATLDPREQRVLRCKYDPAEPEPLGYKQVAQRLRWRIGVVRSVERAIRHKMDRFAAVYTAGRLCDARAIGHRLAGGRNGRSPPGARRVRARRDVRALPPDLRGAAARAALRGV